MKDEPWEDKTVTTVLCGKKQTVLGIFYYVGWKKEF